MKCADKRDELYKQFRNELESLISECTHIVTEPEEICANINGLLENARDGNQPKTLMVWLGIESIGADLSMHPDKSNVQAGKKVPANNAVNDLIDEIDSLLADFDEPKVNDTESDISEKETMGCQAYDARDDISELISKGSRFGIHSLVTYSSVKMLRQSRFVKLECFEHKIAFAMSRDDWSNYLERVHYLTDLDNISAVYYDGGSTTHIFRPYLIQ